MLPVLLHLRHALRGGAAVAEQALEHQPGMRLSRIGSGGIAPGNGIDEKAVAGVACNGSGLPARISIDGTWDSRQ